MVKKFTKSYSFNQINADTGVLSVASATLNRETTSTYTLMVRATDKGSPALTDDTAVYITLNDINDITPVFSSTTYNASVYEGTAPGIARC